MAARRLIAVLIVLLAFSITLAALNPIEPPGESTTTTTTTPTETEPRFPDSETVEIEIGPGRTRAERVEVETGDRLQLTVLADEPGEITVSGLGLRAFASPLSPARFDVILLRRGTHRVRADGSDRELAVIEVADPPDAGDERRSDAPETAERHP